MIVLAAGADRVQRGRGAARAEREDAVVVVARRAPRPSGSAPSPGVLERHGQRLHRPARLRQAVAQAAAALVQAGVAVLLVDAQRVPHARARHPLAGLDARRVLGLADVREHAQLAELVAAGVDRDHGDVGLHRGLDRGLERRRVGQRDDQPVGPVGDRLVDVAPHALDREAVRRAVGDLDAGLAARLGDPALDGVPERVRGLAVGDEDDPRGRDPHAARLAVGGVARSGSRRRRRPRGPARASGSSRPQPARRRARTSRASAGLMCAPPRPPASRARSGCAPPGGCRRRAGWRPRAARRAPAGDRPARAARSRPRSPRRPCRRR